MPSTNKTGMINESEAASYFGLIFARPDHQGSCQEKVKGRLVPVELIHGGTDEQPLQQSAQPAWWFLCSSRPWSGGCCCCCCCLTQIILQVVLGERILSWSVDLWLEGLPNQAGTRQSAGQFWLQMRSVRSKKKKKRLTPIYSTCGVKWRSC